MAVSSSPSPIWQGARRVLSSTGGLTVPYTVRTDDDGRLIYSGKAVPTPGSAQTVVELFDVLAPYVRNEDILDEMQEANEEGYAMFIPSKCNRTFRLTYSGQTSYLYEFADYSYEEQWPDNPMFLAVPVVDRIPRYATLCVTAKYVGAGTIYIRNASGTNLASYTVPSGEEGAYNIVFPMNVAEGVRVRVVLPSGATSPWYTAEASCGDLYVLHYVNASGGWDTLPLRGVCRRTDSFEREGVELGGRRVSSYSHLAPQRAVSRVTRGARWELNTGILTDAQSRIFAINVPGATRAILETSRGFFPVAVTDTEVQNWKTAANNGRVPASYTLTVELQQDLVRL